MSTKVVYFYRFIEGYETDENHEFYIFNVFQSKLWVFPEGTRRNTGEIHSFKKGAFHMAIAGQIPIIPVVFSRYYFLEKKEKRFDHGNLI